MKFSGRNIRVNLSLCLFFCLIIIPVSIFASQDKHFPVPPFLCDNVLFWKNVYTNVSVDEGLLHDRKYPLIIYQKIHVGNRRGRTLDQFVSGYKNRIADVLRTIMNKPASGRTDEEKRFIDMFNEYSSLNDIPQAIGRIRFQLGQRESFLKGLEQSGMYIDEIFAIIKRENVPLRLAYLPHVESAFNIYAVSKAGAVGLWQFMWETGKAYLDIDRYIDERRDPILSTEAAIQLLKENYDELKSWPLAITAYNYGLAGIKRAIRSTGSRDIATIIQKHKSRSFQFASKNFYSCFLAACEIDENYKRYFKLVSMATPLLRKRLIIETPMRPIDICKELNIDISEFKALNPAYKPALYKYQAVIPKHYTVFLPLSISGEKFGDIFQFPTSIKQNDMQPEPSQKKHAFKDQKHEPPKKNKAIKTSQSKKKSDIRLPLPQKMKYQKYRVKKGDSIWLIAKKFHTDIKTLRKLNGLRKRAYLYPGQRLQVPVIPSKKSYKKETKKVTKRETKTSQPTNLKEIQPKQRSTSNKSVSPEPQKSKNSIIWKKYGVKEGDTLWDISKAMNVSTEQLKKVNKLKTQKLQPGQVLFVPHLSHASSIKLPESTKKNDHQAAIERIKRLQEQQKEQYIIDYYYTVKSGEDLKHISQKTGIPLEQIAIINHMSDDLRVYEGQVLRIPKKKGK
jgi:membrane-bound lytic murein transglycosylase D